MTAWSALGGCQGMGTLEQDIAYQIHELRERQNEIYNNKRNYYNWELSANRIDLMIDRLYRQQKVAQILES